MSSRRDLVIQLTFSSVVTTGQGIFFSQSEPLP